MDEAKRETRRALEIDPMSANFLADLGQMYYFAREYVEAESYCHKALEVAPDFNLAREYLFDIYLKMGRASEAFEECRKREKVNAFDTAKDNEPADARLRAQYLGSCTRVFLRQRIEHLLRAPGTNKSHQLAKLYTLLSERDQALSLLEKSYDDKDFLLPFVNSDPIFDDLRAEPRFQAILHRMGLGL